jgi:hypothetical protein
VHERDYPHAVALDPDAADRHCHARGAASARVRVQPRLGAVGLGVDLDGPLRRRGKQEPIMSAMTIETIGQSPLIASGYRPR